MQKNSGHSTANQRSGVKEFGDIRGDLREPSADAEKYGCPRNSFMPLRAQTLPPDDAVSEPMRHRATACFHPAYNSSRRVAGIWGSKVRSATQKLSSSSTLF